MWYLLERDSILPYFIEFRTIALGIYKTLHTFVRNKSYSNY